MEHEKMCQKILCKISELILANTSIRDFAIIPSEHNTTNKSPIIVRPYHLGLESWCIRHVYDYACARLMLLRKNVAEKTLPFTFNYELQYLLTGALLINPDVTTFWNMRKEWLEHFKGSTDDELYFSKLVLTRKPKSNEAFAYRRWLIERILNKWLEQTPEGPLLPFEGPPFSIFGADLQVCELTADLSSNNYHSWTHREWCVTKFAKYYPQAVIEEFHTSETWIKKNVSQSCGYFYRQTLIKIIKDLDVDVCLPNRYCYKVMELLNYPFSIDHQKFLIYLLGSPKQKSKVNFLKYIRYVTILLYDLLELIHIINLYYTEHESLWLHRRYVLYHLLELVREYFDEPFDKNSLDSINDLVCNSGCKNTNVISVICNESNCGEKKPKVFKSEPSQFQKTKLYEILCDKERYFIKSNMIKSEVEASYAKRHEKWLKYIAGFDLKDL